MYFRKVIPSLVQRIIHEDTTQLYEYACFVKSSMKRTEDLHAPFMLKKLYNHQEEVTINSLSYKFQKFGFLLLIF